MLLKITGVITATYKLLFITFYFGISPFQVISIVKSSNLMVHQTDEVEFICFVEGIAWLA